MTTDFTSIRTLSTCWQTHYAWSSLGKGFYWLVCKTLSKYSVTSWHNFGCELYWPRMKFSWIVQRSFFTIQLTIILTMLFKQNYTSNMNPCKPWNTGFHPTQMSGELGKDWECDSRVDQRPMQQSLFPLIFNTTPFQRRLTSQVLKVPQRKWMSVQMNDKAATSRNEQHDWNIWLPRESYFHWFL